MMETITRDQKVEVHPAADVFPQMAEAEFQELRDDIERCGVREPVWVGADGRLLDGRHRLRACQQLGMETPCEVYEGADVVDFVLSLNLNRRHLNESQRAMVAERLANLHQGDNQHTGVVGPIGPTSLAAAANQLRVSSTSVKRARGLRERNIPALVAAVERGELPVSVAKEVVDLPKDEQRALLEDGPAAVKAGAAEVRQARRVQAREREVVPGGNDEGVAEAPKAAEARPVEQEESGDAEEPDDGAGADTFAPPAHVLDSVPAEDIELPLVTDRDRELLQYRLAPVEDAIDNLLDLPDPWVVSQLLHDRGHLNPDDVEKAAWWLSEMAVAYRCCVSAKGKPPART